MKLNFKSEENAHIFDTLTSQHKNLRKVKQNRTKERIKRKEKCDNQNT